MIYTSNGQPATRITFSAPTTREDGSGFSEAEFGNYTLGFEQEDGSVKEHASFPGQYNDGVWLFNDMGIPMPGDYVGRLATVDSDGVQGDWSDPFSFTARNAAPNPPSGIRVS